MDKKKVAIIGASGYTGLELVRILAYHPGISIELITSETHQGKRFSDLYPHLKGIADYKLKSLDTLGDHNPDLVFLALPHRVSMDFVKKHGYSDYKVIDLSGDFRLDSAEIYEKWYDKEHEIPGAIDDAVYGLPELFRSKIKDASLVANPGCYPTSSILPLAPLVNEGLIEPTGIVVDAKSGVTGAGAKAKPKTHFPNANDNFSAYGVKTHRHMPEIEGTVSNYSGQDTQVIFTPHLLPVNRGILATTYSTPKAGGLTDEKIRAAYNSVYADEPFIRMVDNPPELLDIRGSNYCNIFATYDPRTNKVITISVIDNLVKGAAGQAVQNMNIMFGFEEGEALKTAPLSP